MYKEFLKLTLTKLKISIQSTQTHEAATRVQWPEWLATMPASHIGAAGQVSATPSLTQIPAEVPKEARLPEHLAPRPTHVRNDQSPGILALAATTPSYFKCLGSEPADRKIKKNLNLLMFWLSLSLHPSNSCLLLSFCLSNQLILKTSHLKTIFSSDFITIDFLISLPFIEKSLRRESALSTTILPVVHTLSGIQCTIQHNLLYEKWI